MISVARIMVVLIAVCPLVYSHDCDFRSSIFDLAMDHKAQFLRYDSMATSKRKIAHFTSLANGDGVFVNNFDAAFYFYRGDTVLLFGKDIDAKCGFYFILYSGGRISFPLANRVDMLMLDSVFKSIYNGPDGVVVQRKRNVRGK